MQVTNATDNSVEIRALVSAANSAALWDLRCLVREELIAFLRLNYPSSLPKVMMEPTPVSGTGVQNKISV